MNRSSQFYQCRPRGRGYNSHRGHQRRTNAYSWASVTISTDKNNEEHWCETCDRGFPTVDILDKHKQQHQKCNIDGCQFVAHPNVITKHIQMQHSSGLYKKISKLDNPEDIQRWREERKRKYPTRINIEKKAAEFEEKIERGEKMALKLSRHDNQRSKMHSGKTDHTRDRKRKHSYDRNNQMQKSFSNNKEQTPANKVSKNIPKLPSVIVKNKLKPFAGIISILMNDNEVDVNNGTDNSNSLIEDDYFEESVTCETKNPTKEPALCGALTLLMCDYGSSEDEIHEKENKSLVKATTVKHIESTNNFEQHPETVNVKTNLDTVQHVQKERNIPQETGTEQIDKNENSDDDGGPKEVKTIKSSVIEDSTLEEPNKDAKQVLSTKKLIKPKKDKQKNLYKPKVPSTLLHKLLHKEIRQERNIVLQCIRYIKRTDYFAKTVE